MSCAQLVYESARSFIRDRGSMFAASMSFYAIMAIIPFCLFLITLVGFVLGKNPAFQQFIISKIVELFPAVTRGITDEIMMLISYKGIGVFSFALYSYLSFKLLKATEFAINAIFEVPLKRTVHHSLLMSVGIITLIVLVFLSSFSVATLGSIPDFLSKFVPAFEINILTAILIRFIMPFLIAWMIITLLYIMLPLKRPGVVIAFKAAFFISVLLEIAKHAFTLYIGNMTRLGHIYGSLTAFIIFFLWVYYSSCLFLLGAEMIKVLTTKEEEIYEPSYW